MLETCDQFVTISPQTVSMGGSGNLLKTDKQNTESERGKDHCTINLRNSIVERINQTEIKTQRNPMDR